MLRSKRLNNIILERNIVYSTYWASKFRRKKVNPTLALRTRKKKDQRSASKRRSHTHKFVTCLGNGTSLLAVRCPCKTPAGWPFWCPYRNVDFQHITVHRTTTSRKPQVKIRLAFHFGECNWLNVTDTTYNLRGQHLLNVPRVNTTTYGIHSLRYFASKLWNLLTNSLRLMHLN